MEAWNLYKQCSEETRRLRERQRRHKSKLISSTPTVPQPSSSSLAVPQPQSSNERIVVRHDFADPTSGGLVATFTELLHCRSVGAPFVNRFALALNFSNFLLSIIASENAGTIRYELYQYSAKALYVSRGPQAMFTEWKR